MTRAPDRLWPVLALALAAPLGACGKGAAEPPATLSVFAAASLTEAADELARAFEARHPGVDVVVSTAGSQVLRLQIEQGARADVFASADASHVRALADAGLVARSALLAKNGLAVVVPRTGNTLATLEDLARAQRLVLGTDAVPIGAYARTLLSRAGARYGEAWRATVEGHVVSEESNVRLLRAKVELGEADAAIVYRTDAAATDAVRTLAVPPDLDVRADYHIASLTRSTRPELADAFVSLALSAAGQDVLARHGFLPAAAP